MLLFAGSGPLEYLLSKGVACKSLTHDGITPLMIAAMHNRVDNVKILIKADLADQVCWILIYMTKTERKQYG